MSDNAKAKVIAELKRVYSDPVVWVFIGGGVLIALVTNNLLAGMVGVAVGSTTYLWGRRDE